MKESDSILYTIPKLTKSTRIKNGKQLPDWFIYFQHYHPSLKSMKPVKIRANMNRIKNEREREKYADKLLKATRESLKNGYNPFKEEAEAIETIQKLEKSAEGGNIIDVCSKFLNEKIEVNLAEESLRSYFTHTNGFVQYIIDNLPFDSNFEDLTLEVVTDYMNGKYDSGEWKETSFNNVHGFLKTLFLWHKKKNKLLLPVVDMSDIPEKIARVEKNTAFNEVVKNLIRPELAKYPKIELFAKFIYYLGIRIKELREIQIANVHFAARMIKVPATVGKTGGSLGDRFIPICDELMEIIDEMDLKAYPPNYYIFGKEGQVSAIKSGKGYYSEKFGDILEKLNLGSQYNLYSWKHTRVTDLYAAGYSDDQVMQLTGHTDIVSFSKYCRSIGANRGNVFKGKTTSF